VINLNCGLILLCFLVLLCFSGKINGATNEVVNALPPAAAEGKTLDAGALPRDPFCPIGYVPPSEHGGTVAPATTNSADSGKETVRHISGLSEMLKIGGVIRKGGKFYATINGFTVQTGEVVTAVADGEVYKFVVEKIDFKKVQIRPVR
jgi:hypothetical protein